MTKEKRSIAGKLRGLMSTCQDMTMLIIKEQEVPLSVMEKLKLYTHVYIVCKFCRLFRKQSWALHHHVQKMAQEQTVGHHLSTEQKERLQALINKEEKNL
jgi:hypothetical protein